MFHELIVRVERRHLDLPSIDVARLIVRHLAASQRNEALAQLLEEDVDAIRRARVRDIEQAAVNATPHRTGRDEEQELVERDRLALEERRALWKLNPRSAPKSSREYKDWLANTPEGRAVADAREEAEDRRRLFREDPEAYSKKYGWQHAVQEYEESVRQQARLELTAELLGASFALGDGRTVTWGEATLDDHEQRIELLFGNVSGNLATIAVHERAAELLRSAGASCLNDMKVAA
jgi:hypothetical protein